MQSALETGKSAAVDYNDTVVRRFAFMPVIWGIVGMAVGVLIAAELIWPNRSVRLAQRRKFFSRSSPRDNFMLGAERSFR